MSWLDDHADVECCDIVTTGRRTGDPHEIEIWFGVAEGLMYLISGNGPGCRLVPRPARPSEVVVKLAGHERIGRARDVGDRDERRRCGELMSAKYVRGGDPEIGLTDDAWCYDVPAIAIEFD